MFCCRPPPGARRTAPSPTPSGASRASAPSCRCRARRSPTGGSSREVARRMGFGDAFAYRCAGRRLPRARRAVGLRERRHARLRHRRARRDLSDDDFDALEPVQWPVRAGDAARPRRASSPMAASSRPTARRASSRPSRRRCARRPAREFPFRLNTGRVRDQWHTMTRTGPEPAARRAHAGAVRRGPSGRCRGARACAHGGFARVSHAHTAPACSRSWSATASSAARCSCRSTGATPTRPRRASASWSRRRPIRSPASRRPRRRRPRSRRSHSRYRGFALSRARAGAAGRDLVGARRRWRRRRACCSRAMMPPSAWRELVPGLFGGDAEIAEFLDEPRGIYRVGQLRRGTARPAACSSARPRRRRNGTRLKALFEAETLGEAQRRAAAVGQIGRRVWPTLVRSSAPVSASA